MDGSRDLEALRFEPPVIDPKLGLHAVVFQRLPRGKRVEAVGGTGDRDDQWNLLGDPAIFGDQVDMPLEA